MSEKYFKNEDAHEVYKIDGNKLYCYSLMSEADNENVMKTLNTNIRETEHRIRVIEEQRDNYVRTQNNMIDDLIKYKKLMQDIKDEFADMQKAVSDEPRIY